MGNSRLAMVILGASGDLTRRKLMPALSALHGQGRLPPGTLIAGCGRTSYTDPAFRERFDVSGDFAASLFYKTRIKGLKTFLEEKGSFTRIVFFMALPPSAYVPAAQSLLREGFDNRTALVLEKPFGHDLASARALNRALAAGFNENQIFRMDHYLAKEAVQNILVFRFANTCFEPVWNSRYIESIHVSGAEMGGVGERGAYFERAGIIRDMIQNHLMQLLSLLTMEAPESLDAGEISARKIEVLRRLRIEKCRRFQYRGYRAEKGVATDSQTETFAEMVLSIRSPRWAGMPVYLRSGKGLDRQGTEIGVRFRPPLPALFPGREGIENNQVIFKIQPREGVILRFSSKTPGSEALTGTNMKFCWREASDNEFPDAYQKLLLDIIHNDHTLFVGAGETECAWKAVEPVLDKGEVALYDKGSLPEPGLNPSWVDFRSFDPECG